MDVYIIEFMYICAFYYQWIAFKINPRERIMIQMIYNIQYPKYLKTTYQKGGKLSTILKEG